MIKGLFFLLLFIASLYYAYKPWIHPEEYLNKIRKKRRQANKKNILVLFQLSSSRYLNRHATYDLWLVRLTSLLLVLGFAIAFVAALALPSQ